MPAQKPIMQKSTTSLDLTNLSNKYNLKIDTSDLQA